MEKDKPTAGTGSEAPAPEVNRITLTNIDDGAAVTGFEMEWANILANIQDLSTVATATREFHLKILVKPESDRTVLHTELSVSSKLAPIETHKSKVFCAWDEATGEAVAVDKDVRRPTLWATPAPKIVNPIVFGAPKAE